MPQGPKSKKKVIPTPSKVRKGNKTPWTKKSKNLAAPKKVKKLIKKKKGSTA